MSDLELVRASAEQTDLSIQYSTKISKQVIKARLTDELVKAKAAYTELEATERASYNNTLLVVRSRIKSAIHMEIANDGEITRFRNLLNKYKPAGMPDYAKNTDLIANVYYPVFTAILQDSTYGYSTNTVTEVKQGIDKGYVEVTVDFKVLFGDPDDISEDVHTGFTICVDLLSDAQGKVKEHLALLSAINNARKEVASIEAKLSGLDSMVEELEARLLLDKLQSSEEGRKVLEITNSLVENALGTLPPLLGGPAQ